MRNYASDIPKPPYFSQRDEIRQAHGRFPGSYGNEKINDSGSSSNYDDSTGPRLEPKGLCDNDISKSESFYEDTVNDCELRTGLDNE